MPFFVQPPPPVEIPRTQMEYVHPDFPSDLVDVSPELKNIVLDEDLFESVYLRDKFISLYNAWESNTMLESSVSKIIDDRSFKRIVEMGDKAIPLIIEEIDRNPSTLVWALNLITNSNISTSHRLTISEACKLWVRKWKQGA